MPVDAPRKATDAPPAGHVAAFPIAARRLIQARRHDLAIGGDIRLVVRPREEAMEGGMIGQRLRRHQLQPVERDMGGVEVDRRDLRRIGGQIGEDIAAARRDRHHMTVGRDRQRFHVDRWIFPDLGIDQATEGEGEGAFQQPLLRQMAVTMHRVGDFLVGRCGHGRTPRCRVVRSADRAGACRAHDRWVTP